MTGYASRPDESSAATPIRISRRTQRVLVAAGLAALILLCWRAPTLLALSIGGVALAVALSIPVRAFSRVMPRGVAIALSILLAVVLVVVVITVVAPVVLDQLRALLSAVPDIAQQLDERVPPVLDRLAARGLLPDSPARVLEQIQQRLMTGAQELVGHLFGRFGRFVSGAAGVAVLLLGDLLVAVYLLADARDIQAAVLRASPHRYRRDVRALGDAVSETLARYLGGLLLSVAAEGALAAIAFAILGLPYAFLFGVWVSLTAFIPYVGAWIGYAPALLVALSISTSRALVALVICLLINAFVGNVVSPRIQGRAVRVHPALVFLAVVLGGQLFGVAGVLFAVPSVAVLRVLFDFFRERLVVVDEATAEHGRDDGAGDGSGAVTLPREAAQSTRARVATLP
jgi:predicted PurR-regulated permease PerM